MIKKIIFSFAAFFYLFNLCTAQNFSIKNNKQSHVITFGNSKLKFVLTYDHQCRISEMFVNGQTIIDTSAGIYSEIKTLDKNFTTLQLAASPVISVSGNEINISGIKYGDGNKMINESWKFVINEPDINFTLSRNILKAFEVESVSFPAIEFNNVHTWEGAFQGFGGIAWFYLFNEKLCTYGVHTNEASFWNSKTNNGLNISVEAKGKQVAMKYTRTENDDLAYSIAISEKAMLPRYDSGTNRRRFIRQKTNVWAPFKLLAGNTSQSITLSYFDFNKKYGRGEMKGVNGKQVASVLNTIARMGVIDAEHFGGNSWHTPYGPICLHEQYIAQMGLGINDPHYLEGYQQCLDFYRDNAIKPDGRVWPRWAYTNEDAMPGQFTNKGFYEAQWGYLLDSNPDYVTNVSELYDQTGDKAWVKKQQFACEKALEYLLKRDSNGNHLVEMMNDNHTQKRSSDWIDIIWASFENAFVNAKLFHALQLWSGIEAQLGDSKKASYYADYAAELKKSFNKSVSNGGFWDEDKGCYIYWRDKNNSTHGDNLVTPVNFMAIAYGICDDTVRRNTILDRIEDEMQKEKLFFWPISMFPYKTDEGKEYQFPFPYYENGDIFLSWGSVEVKAYAMYKPGLALHYIKNILRQDSLDGLAFQRYSRKTQTGQGDDILSGNSLAIVGLYEAIYGFNPLYNRFYLNPHITNEISGSKINYNYRGTRLLIGLDSNLYTISNNQFTVGASNDFGFFSKENSVFYFDKNSPDFLMHVQAKKIKHLRLTIKKYNQQMFGWNQLSNDKMGEIVYTISKMTAHHIYSIYADNRLASKIKADAKGQLTFTRAGKNEEMKIMR